MLDELGDIKNDLRDYADVKLDLIKLQVAETLSKVISKTAIIAVAALLFSLVMLFLSFAAGYFLASRLHSNEAGFLCVAGFYFLILTIFLLFRKRLVERPVIRSVVKMFFSKEVKDEK